MKKLILFLFIVNSYIVQAQPFSLAWQQIYDFPYRPMKFASNASCSYRDGSFWVAGIRDTAHYATMIFLRKYDPHANFLHESKYYIPLFSNIGVTDVTCDGNGNVYVAGKTSGNNSDDFLLLKYAPDGTFLWEYHYDDPFHGWDLTRRVSTDANLNVYITGNVSDSTTLSYQRTVINSVDSSGNFRWQKKLNPTSSSYDDYLKIDGQSRIIAIEGTGTDTAYINFLDTSGNILSQILIDSIYSFPIATKAADDSGNVFFGAIQTGSNQFILRRFDSSGNIVWQWQGQDRYRKIILNYPDIYLAGSYGSDFYLTKITYTGNLVWAKQFTDPLSQNKITGSFAFTNNRLYLSGYNVDVNNAFDTFLHQFDTAGTLIRSRVFDYLHGNDYDVSSCVNDSGIYFLPINSERHVHQNNFMFFACDSSMQDTVFYSEINFQHSPEGSYRLYEDGMGNVIAAVNGYDSTGTAIVRLLKYDVNGNPIWHTPVWLADYAILYSNNIEIDSSDNFFPYGTIYNLGNHFGNYVARINSSGQLQWSKLFFNTYSNSVSINSLVSDNAGSLYLYSSNKDSLSASPSYLMKINYAGDSLWAKKIDSIPAGFTYSTKIIFRNGLLYMLAETVAQPAGKFYFSRSDTAGNILQSKKLNGPLSGNESKGKMIRDAENNFIIYGTTTDTSGAVRPKSWYVVKVDSVGTILWDYKYVSDSGLYSVPYDACVDANNNIYICGSSEDGTVNTKWKIIKLDPSGNRVWSDSLLFKSFFLMKMAYNNGQLHAVINKYDDNGSVYVVYDTSGTRLFTDSSGINKRIYDIIPSPDELLMSGESIGDTTIADILVQKYTNLWASIKIFSEPYHALNVYPNPARREVNLSFEVESAGKYLIRAYDQLSSLVYENTIDCKPGESKMKLILPVSSAGILHLIITGKNYKAMNDIVISDR